MLSLRTAACSLALLSALYSSVLAQKKSVPLRIEGDTVVVVKSFPCKVHAPGGYDFYLWSFPDSVAASEDSDGVLTVTKAPKGTHKIRVVTARFDFEQKKVIKDRGDIDLAVGEVPGPTPPVPPGPDPPVPPPVDPLVKALQAAYDSEAATDKATSLAGIQSVYSTASKLVRDNKATTFGQLWRAIEAGADAAKVRGKLKGVQQVAFDQVLSRLPTKSSDKIDDSNRDRVAGAFDGLVLALGQLKKGE